MTSSVSSILVYSLLGIAVVMVTLFGMQIIITVMSKVLSYFIKQTPDTAHKPGNSSPTLQKKIPSRESGSVSGEVEISDTDEKTTAIIMASVSHHTGIPVGHLRFNSIKKL